MATLEAEIVHAATQVQHRFLPEGLCVVQLDGKDHAAGVVIQTSAEATGGCLWFLPLNDDGTTGNAVYVDIVQERPGWFRPTDRENTFVVGLEHQVALVSVAAGAVAGFDVIAEFPSELVPKVTIGDTTSADGDKRLRIMMNDGTVAPNGHDLICGTKDFKFDTDARIARTLIKRGASDFQIAFARETCANGNAFVVDQTNRTFWLHVETASKKLLAVPYGADQKLPYDTASARVLVDFDNRKVFDAFDPDLYHEALMPDGICHWTTSAADVTKHHVAVSTFDFRNSYAQPSDPLPAGCTIVFDVTDFDNVCITHVIKTPGSPRVTHPFIVKRKHSVQLWMTTADEGLLKDRGSGDPKKGQGIFPNVGALFAAELPDMRPEQVTVELTAYKASKGE